MSFLDAFSSTGKSRTLENQLVTIVMGSSEATGGIWMQQDVAIEFGNYSVYFDTIVFSIFDLAMKQLETLKLTIARDIIDQTLSKQERSDFYSWEMESVELVGENFVVWLN